MVLAYNPRPLILVTLRGEAQVMGKKNISEDIISLTWHTPVDDDKYLIVLSKKYDYALTLLRESKVFVAHFMPKGLENAAHAAAHHAGEYSDKFIITGLTKGESHSVDCPIIEEAVSLLECEIEQEIDFGNHVAFIGRIVDAEIKNGNAKKLFHIDGERFTTTVDS